MIESFGDEGTEAIFLKKKSKDARKILSESLHSIAKRKLNYIAVAVTLNDLKAPPGSRLESLKGDLKTYYSIRINDQWRIVFQWQNGRALNVKIIDYHKR